MQTALDALSDEWKSAYVLRQRMQTLDALVARGLAQRRGYGRLGAQWSPTTTIEYRLTPFVTKLVP